jgi:hypothetical protein
MDAKLISLFKEANPIEVLRSRLNLKPQPE